MSGTKAELSGYLRRVERALDCPPDRRRALMERVQRDVERFLDEQPDATATAAAEYLGDPEELARGLLETLDQEELEQYRHRGARLRRGMVILLIAVLVAALIGTWMYVFHLRKNRVQIEIIPGPSAAVTQGISDPYAAL